MRKYTRRTSAVAAGIVALTGVGVAFAAWSSDGSGTGSATATHDQESTITAVTPVVDDYLYPGATKTTQVTIDNPNDYDVVVTQIDAGWSRLVATTCVAGTVRTDQLGTGAAAVLQSDGLTTVIPAGEDANYTLTLRMSDDPAESCKDQDFVLGDATTPANDMHASLKSAADEQSF